jgi:hypothetical protein
VSKGLGKLPVETFHDSPRRLHDILKVVRFLGSDAGLAIRRALPQQCEPRDVVRWRALFGPEAAHWLATLVELTSKANEKLGAGPSEWMYTRRSLEQASSSSLARYKAGRIPKGARIVDACCGMGVDLAALAGRGSAIGFELDPVLCRVAATNASHAVRGGVATVSGDCRRIDLGAACWLHADPDRRPSGRRTSDAERAEPPLDELWHLQRNAAGAAIKLAPIATIEPSIALGVEREWLSNGRECKQQVLWRGEPFSNGLRRATRVLSDGSSASFIACDAGASMDRHPSTTSTVGRWLFDLDPAIRAAGLSVAYAAQWDWHSVGGPQAFFTAETDRLPEHGAAPRLTQAFEVIAVCPLDRRVVRQELRRRRLTVEVVKARGLRGQWSTDPRAYRVNDSRPPDRSTGSPSRSPAPPPDTGFDEAGCALLLSQAGSVRFAAICRPAARDGDGTH